MKEFLQATSIIDWTHPDVVQRARLLRSEPFNPMTTAKACFEWVRDEIKHSRDHRLKPISRTASEALRAGSGYCYAKSHLLAALLRANGIPAGFCYQRLSRDGNGAPYCLHGFNAVYLSDYGWYRIDPRGNRSGIDARFDPPTEHLAFTITEAGEADLPEIWPDPLGVIVDVLSHYSDADALWHMLPDVQLLHVIAHRHSAILRKPLYDVEKE